MQKKTVHIGPLPPPVGGISVYLYRLSKKMADDPYVVFINEKGLTTLRFILFLLFGKNKQVIYHSPILKRRILIYLISKIVGYSYVIVSHGKGLEEQYNNCNRIIKDLLLRTIFNAEYIQVVGVHLKMFLINLGYDENKIIVKNAFLPPPLDDEINILRSYPESLDIFIKKSRPVLIANASKIVFIDNIDLYGLDLCVELTALLQKKYQDVGFVFALADENENAGYLNKMKTKIKDLGIEDNFYFLTGQKELWPLFKKADIMIRPTCSDGYGISIAEALYFGCPAIASNVSDRPQGTILFNNRDIEDLYNKTKEILNAKRVY